MDHYVAEIGTNEQELDEYQIQEQPKTISDCRNTNLHAA